MSCSSQLRVLGREKKPRIAMSSPVKGVAVRRCVERGERPVVVVSRTRRRKDRALRHPAPIPCDASTYVPDQDVLRDGHCPTAGRSIPESDT